LVVPHEKAAPDGRQAWLSGGSLVGSGGLQVAQAVIASVTVPARDIVGWHPSSYVQDRQPVCKIGDSINGDFTKSVRTRAACDIAYADSIRSSFAPTKESGLSVVAKSLP
jgi:hypothetical protein